MCYQLTKLFPFKLQFSYTGKAVCFQSVQPHQVSLTVGQNICFVQNITSSLCILIKKYLREFLKNNLYYISAWPGLSPGDLLINNDNRPLSDPCAASL